MKPIQLVLGIAALAGFCAPAAAQSFDNTVAPAPGEVRIQAGIVIPLGTGGTAAERAPRIETWSDPRQQRALPQASLGQAYDQPRMRPVRIGVNFSGDPRLMLNGREMPGQSDKKGISTLGVVGIGVVVVVVIAVVAVSSTNLYPTN
ncbi:hypothetical protein [Novosphingobium sp.]|uniref:hypothetical protein n=1 Tax=Novosphingobium sp. TaxID=1874826 RepID=UPI00286CD66F|nr:hypothetical protein [Novosphingobium sp.]